MTDLSRLNANTYQYGNPNALAASRPSDSPVGTAPVSTPPVSAQSGAPPYHDLRYTNDAPPQITPDVRVALSRRMDRMSGPWYNNRSGDVDTIIFHTDVATENNPLALVSEFNGNWTVPERQNACRAAAIAKGLDPDKANCPVKKSYHAQILRQPYDGKGTNLFVPFEYDAWHARTWSRQSIGIAFNNDFIPARHELTQFQVDTATQWVRYLCQRFPTIKHVTRHGQVDPTRRSDPNQVGANGQVITGATNFDLQHFINVCSQATGRPVSDCPVDSECHSRRRAPGARVPGAPVDDPYLAYPQREINQAAISSIAAAKTPVLTGVADLLSFHPNVQYELTRRRLSQNTIHSHMPFVKLTSIMAVTGSNLSDTITNAWCPSIGIHGEMQTEFDDVYATVSNRNIVGYAVTCDNNNCFSTKVLVDSQTADDDPVIVPPPGITSITTDRNLAGGFSIRGGLFRATLKIQAYSVGQVNTLIKYFLRPTTNVVLEIGRNTSQESSSEDIVPELPIDGVTPFPWYRPKDAVKQELLEAIALPEERNRFIQKYVYNNFGKYEIFVCYVANFKIKYNNGVYEIELQVHSVQQMELATQHTGARSTCTNSIANRCKAIDVVEYFGDKFTWKENTFSSLLSQALDSNTQIGKNWSNHIVQIRRAAQDVQNVSSPDVYSAPAGQGEGYYILWRFFVEKVLHDRKYGIMSVFQTEEVQNTPTAAGEVSAEGGYGDDEMSYPLLHATLISPIAGAVTSSAQQDDIASRGRVPKSNSNELMAHEVGYHPALRSTDPSVMLIYNKYAQAQQDETTKNSIARALESLSSDESPLTINDEITKFIQNGEVPAFTNMSGDDNAPGTTFLTQGVWLNTNMIKQSFAGTDSVSTALTNILRNMNNATQGYWNLQLLSNDVQSGKTPGVHVIDAQSKFGNLAAAAANPAGSRLGVLPKVSSEYGQSEVTAYSIIDVYKVGDEISPSGGNNNALGPSTKLPENGFVYMFNRRYRQLTKADDGPELLNLSIDYDLPTALYTQAVIGAGGLSERGLLEVLDVTEINNLSLIKSQLKCPPADEVQADPTKLPPCRYDSPTDYRVPAPNSATPPAASTRASGPGAPPTTGGNTDAERAAAAQQVVEQNENFVNSIRQYGYVGTAINLIEFNPTEMLKKLDTAIEVGATGTTGITAGRTLSRSSVHPFNSSNLTKTQVELTLPGVGGIQLWQTFLLDRVPSIVRNGAYVVSKVAHEFSVDKGWITKITGKFRYLSSAELVNLGFNTAEIYAGTGTQS